MGITWCELLKRYLMWLHSDARVSRYRLMMTLKMVHDSGSPWKRLFARCTGWVSHSFEAITAVRPNYNDWIVLMKCPGKW